MSISKQSGALAYIFQSHQNLAGKPFSLSLQLGSKPGEPAEQIGLYFHTPNNNTDDLYHGFTGDIFIESTAQGYRFLSLLVQDNNLAIEKQWINPADYLNDDIPDSVRAKSNEIVGNETDEYKKVKLLHNWVAKNIYYDYDDYYHHIPTKIDPAGVLETRRSVCAGYANLLRALIQAQGIPAMYNICLTGTYPGYATLESSHAYTEAFVNGRWVRMDAT